jgi:RNA polymerase sigma-70 factor, ECF subfamily
MTPFSAENATTDEELACRAQRGCMASFEQLLRRYQTPVLHFLRRRGFAADAEDLTQESFVRAYEHLHQYNARWRFSTWIFTIARRIGINHARRSKIVNDAIAADVILSDEPKPLDTAIANEQRERLWDAAASVLSEEQHTALWLHYVEDMPTADIALVLRRSRPSVKVMLHRARQKLLPLLTEMDDSDIDAASRRVRGKMCCSERGAL